MKTSFATFYVAPYVGAWIETHNKQRYMNLQDVAPYVGAWIETFKGYLEKAPSLVAPYVGAWIETIVLGYSLGEL